MKPGARLSLQSHARRAEHWIVVRGIARVTHNGDVFRLFANQSTYIPIGAKHRLGNPGTEMLELIGVRVQRLPGRDDIVRYDDNTDGLEVRVRACRTQADTDQPGSPTTRRRCPR